MRHLQTWFAAPFVACSLGTHRRLPLYSTAELHAPPSPHTPALSPSRLHADCTAHSSTPAALELPACRLAPVPSTASRRAHPQTPPAAWPPPPTPSTRDERAEPRTTRPNASLSNPAPLCTISSPPVCFLARNRRSTATHHFRRLREIQAS